MKKFSLWMCGLFVLAIVMAESVAWAADKIGFVNVQEVMAKSDPGKQAWEELKKALDKDKVMIQERETEIKKLREDLEKQRNILNESALREREGAIQRKIRYYEYLTKEINDDLQAKEMEMLRRIYPEVLKIIRAIAEKEKYTMILDPFAVPSQIPYMPYFAKENDITQRVIAEFNKTAKPTKK